MTGGFYGTSLETSPIPGVVEPISFQRVTGGVTQLSQWLMVI